MRKVQLIGGLELWGLKWQQWKALELKWQQ
jgi:hypothetical protein